MASRAALLALLLSAFAAASAVAQLDEKFYSQSCPSVEDVVRKEMVRALSAAPSLAGPLLRMHFHDCFVRVRALHCSVHLGSIGLLLTPFLHPALLADRCRGAMARSSLTPRRTTPRRRTRSRT